MRYEVVFDEEVPPTYYVFDRVRGVVTSNGYMNKYVAQTDCDRLNGEEDKWRGG